MLFLFSASEQNVELYVCRYAKRNARFIGIFPPPYAIHMSALTVLTLSKLLQASGVQREYAIATRRMDGPFGAEPFGSPSVSRSRTGNSDTSKPIGRNPDPYAMAAAHAAHGICQCLSLHHLPVTDQLPPLLPPLSFCITRGCSTNKQFLIADHSYDRVDFHGDPAQPRQGDVRSPALHVPTHSGCLWA